MVLNGTYDFGYIFPVENTSKNKLSNVEIYDYNGTLLKSLYLKKNEVFRLPPPPAHSGLVFEEWVSQTPITDNTVVMQDKNITVVPVYHTQSGASEIDIELNEITGLSFSMQNISEISKIDWGDGYVNKELSHTYAMAGTYTIKLYDIGTFGTSVFCQDSENTLSAYPVTAIRFSKTVTKISTSAFSYCNSLKYAVIPNSITYIGASSFERNNSLKFFALPSSVKSLPATLFRQCIALNKIVISSSVTSIGAGALKNCTNLQSVSFPDEISAIPDSIFISNCNLLNVSLPSTCTTIGIGAFSGCTLIERIIFPKSISKIEASAFYGCINCLTYDFSSLDFVPTLEATNAFDGISPLAKILVPHSLYSEWINATNWTVFSDNIIEV